MKTILLLGGYGFIGSNILHYIDEYCSDQYRVVVFDRFSEHIYGHAFACVQKTYAGDFADEAFIESIFQNEQIDIVLHSLSSTVPATSNSARFDVDSNLLPTITLLDVMLRHKVYDIVFLSSGGAVYGESVAGVLHKESDDVFPKSSYGVVKLCIEKYLFQYSLFGIRPLVLRLSNPYGPYHYSNKQGLINIALRTAAAGEVFHVWGDGEAAKDYIYIGDVCKMLFTLLSKEVYDEVINVGSGEVLTINTILQTIREYYPNFTWTYADKHSTDVSHVALDTSKLRKYVDVEDMMVLNQGINSLL